MEPYASTQTQRSVGWMPSAMTKKMGRGAPKNVSRTARACKRCKQAKNKCDDTLPCRRCLFMGKQADCSAEDEGQREVGIKADSPMAESPGMISQVPAAGAARPEQGEGGGEADSPSLASADSGLALSTSETDLHNGTQSPQEGHRESRPSGGAGGAGVAAHAGARLADGDEGLVAAAPGMEVVSLSPALARRYQLPFGDLVGTSLLAWVLKDGHQELLAAIASVLAGPTPKSAEWVGKMYVQRRALTEVHKCTLRVSSCGSERVVVRIAWGDSMRLWEAAIAPTGELPLPIATSIQRLMRVSLQGAVFTFDELQSHTCISEYIKEGERTGRAPVRRATSTPAVKIMMDKLLSWGTMGSTVTKWQGLRSRNSFAVRLLQVALEIEETTPTSTQPSTAILHMKMRMKLPGMLSGAATPWLTGWQMAFNGESSSSQFTDERYSATIQIDTSTLDPHTLGAQDLPFTFSLLRFQPVGDAARGRRLELIERTTCTVTSEHFAAVVMLLPAAARTGAERASNVGAPDSLSISMQPWTGHFIFARRDLD